MKVRKLAGMSSASNSSARGKSFHMTARSTGP